MHELLQAAGGGEPGADPTAPLDSDTLRTLLLSITERMNASLLNLVLGEGRGPEWAPFLPGAMRPGLPAEASKSRQPQPENGATPPGHGISGIIAEASRRYGVDPDLIHSVIKAESGFDACATSPKGARGLMQLMPETARELGVSDSFDPVQNVMGGTRYLRRLLDRYRGDVKLALAAYNWGMGHVEVSPGKLPQETARYISRVLQYYGEAKA